MFWVFFVLFFIYLSQFLWQNHPLSSAHRDLFKFSESLYNVKHCKLWYTAFKVLNILCSWILFWTRLTIRRHNAYDRLVSPFLLPSHVTDLLPIHLISCKTLLQVFFCSPILVPFAFSSFYCPYLKILEMCGCHQIQNDPIYFMKWNCRYSIM